MRRFKLRYCSNCLRTERFLDLGPRLVCVRCSKALWKTHVPANRKPKTVSGSRRQKVPLRDVG